MRERTLTFEQAKAQFVHRYTCEHVPAWAKEKSASGKYCAPQYATDQEWYDKTYFYGESELATKKFCYTTDPSWPLGLTLDAPLK